MSKTSKKKLQSQKKRSFENLLDFHLKTAQKVSDLDLRCQMKELLAEGEITNFKILYRNS